MIDAQQRMPPAYDPEALPPGLRYVRTEVADKSVEEFLESQFPRIFWISDDIAAVVTSESSVSRTEIGVLKINGELYCDREQSPLVYATLFRPGPIKRTAARLKGEDAKTLVRFSLSFSERESEHYRIEEQKLLQERREKASR